MAATRLSVRRRRPLLFLLMTGFVAGIAWFTRDAWRPSRRGRLSRGGGANPVVVTTDVADGDAGISAPDSPRPLLHAVPPLAAESAESTGSDHAGADDLTRLEGIGPRMAAALQAQGLRTYVAVAEASSDDLRAALANEGLRFAPSLLTWAEQARLLAAGDEAGFAALTARLGRGGAVTD